MSSDDDLDELLRVVNERPAVRTQTVTLRKEDNSSVHTAFSTCASDDDSLDAFDQLLSKVNEGKIDEITHADVSVANLFPRMSQNEIEDNQSKIDEYIAQTNELTKKLFLELGDFEGNGELPRDIELESEGEEDIEEDIPSEITHGATGLAVEADAVAVALPMCSEVNSVPHNSMIPSHYYGPNRSKLKPNKSICPGNCCLSPSISKSRDTSDNGLKEDVYKATLMSFQVSQCFLLSL